MVVVVLINGMVHVSFTNSSQDSRCCLNIDRVARHCRSRRRLFLATNFFFTWIMKLLLRS